MLQFDFTTNPNGKLFCDIFGDIRMRSQSFSVGAECEITHKGMFLGYAEIEAIRNFPFSRLSDAVAYLNCGHPAAYQAALLNRYYNAGRLLPADTVFSHIVFRYITRNMEAQEIIFKDWWNYKKQMAS